MSVYTLRTQISGICGLAPLVSFPVEETCPEYKKFAAHLNSFITVFILFSSQNDDGRGGGGKKNKVMAEEPLIGFDSIYYIPFIG